MIISLLVIALSFAWLMYETNFLTIRLPYGAKLNKGFMPCAIAENLDLTYKTVVNVGCKITDKIQTLNENLIKALTGIKENQVNICNIIVNRRILLEALKLNKDCGLVEFEPGKITWVNDKANVDRNVIDRTCLKVYLDKTKLTFFNLQPDYKNPHPAKIDFTHSQAKQGISINAGDLIEALNYVMPCIATDGTRPPLECVLFDSDKDAGILRLITADGYRLAKTQIQVSGLPTDKVLIEHDDIKQLNSFLKAIKPDIYRYKDNEGKKVVTKEYPDISILHEYNTLKFSSNNSSITLEKQKCQFPDYEQLIPNSDGYKIEFWSNDMIQAINSLKNVAQQGSGIIRMQFFRQDEFVSKCLLSAKSEEYGANTVEVDCKVSEDCKFALNYKYPLDYLNTVKNTMITMYITSPSSPAKFEVNNKIQVIMPIFVQWDETETVSVPKPIEVESNEPDEMEQTITDELEATLTNEDLARIQSN